MGTKLVLGTFLCLMTALLPTICAMEYKANGGHRIPMLGLGTFTVMKEEELTRALNTALEIGYRHIDTASVYGNEHIIGKVLKEWISSGKVKREELFITTKLSGFDVFPDHIEPALNESLSKLQLDYVDLYLIHFPVGMKFNDKHVSIPQPTDLLGVWRKFEEQVDAGKAKTIGLSNCNISQIERIQKVARIQPANLQVELNAYFQQPKVLDFAKKTNLTVVAYAPLGAPGLNKFFKDVNHEEVRLNNVLDDDVVKKVAEKHHRSPAQVALRFLIQLDVVVIPKSTNPKRLKENFNVFDFTLDDEDMNALKKLDKGPKVKVFTLADAAEDVIHHPEYPFYENVF